MLFIDLQPTNIEQFGTLKKYLDTVVLPALSQTLISEEQLPDLLQGYEAIRTITSGYGETYTLYISDRKKMISLFTTGISGKWVDHEYFYMIQQIAETINLPE